MLIRNKLLLGAILSFLLCASLILSAKADATMWTQTYGGSEYDEAWSLVATSDGGYALAGSTRSFGAGHRDFWLVKTDEFGFVPEAAWVVLPLLVTATLAILITRKKLHTRL